MLREPRYVTEWRDGAQDAKQRITDAEAELDVGGSVDVSEVADEVLLGSVERKRKLEEAVEVRVDVPPRARSALIEQLHANRGGLRVLYPRESRRRRSFFPDTRRRPVPEPEELDAETHGDAVSEAS